MIGTLGFEAAGMLATTGGEFNSMPLIIGAIALVVLGGAAMLVMRRRRASDEADGGLPHEPAPRESIDPDSP